jgi:hypothetical protein
VLHYLQVIISETRRWHQRERQEIGREGGEGEGGRAGGREEEERERERERERLRACSL